MVNEVNIHTVFFSLKFKKVDVYLQRNKRERKTKRGVYPSFFLRIFTMIDANQIKTIAESFLAEGSGFLVDVRVSEGNSISILLDDDEGTSIEKCMALSRHLESSLDRDVEDFSLDVSSPGLDQPLRLHRQYLKNIGRLVQVKVTDAGKVEGKMIKASEEEITLVVREKRRIEGRKAKAWIEEEQTFPLNGLDWTKVQVSFKRD